MRIDWSFRPWERWTLSVFGLLMVFGVLIAVNCWNEANSEPLITRYDVRVKGLPPGRPVSVAFLSDTHVNAHWYVSPTSLYRLLHIVDLTNALKPDVVLLGGDYIATTHRSGDVPFAQAVAPFAGLRARYGVFAVIGNHDCQEPENTTARMSAALTAAHAHPLVNATAQAGPVQIAGIDDLWCGDPDIGVARRAETEAQGRPVVLVSHNPDVFPAVPASVALTIAGHTHAGQIVPPLIGPIVSVSRYGSRFRYGMIVEGGRRLIVSSGLGGLPLRWNAAPEIVLVRLIPA